MFLLLLPLYGWIHRLGWVAGCKRVGNFLLEPFGGLLSATAGDERLELGFEVERLQARRAVVEVVVDGFAPLDGELVLDKPGHGMFWGTRLQEILQANCITHLVLTGASTETAVESSLREAHDRGYTCLLVADATESYDPALKAATLAMIGGPRAMLGWHATSDALLRALRLSP